MTRSALVLGGTAATVRDEVEWLVAAARGGPESELLPPADDEYFVPLLDYAAEDRRLELRQSE